MAGKDAILSVVMTTVLLSIFAHGLTAFPGTNWYAQYTEQSDPTSAEHKPVEGMPVRLTYVSGRSSDKVPSVP